MEAALLYALSHIVEGIIAYYFFYNIFSNIISKHSKLIFIFGYFTLFLSMFLKLNALNMIVYTLTNMVMVKIIYQPKTSTAFYYSLILTIFMAASEYITALIPHNFYEDFNVSEPTSPYVLLYFLSSKTLYFLFVMFFIRIKTNKADNIYASTPVYLIIIITLSVILLISLYSIITNQPLNKSSRYCILVSSSAILIIDITVFWLKNYVQKKDEAITDMMLTLQQDNNSRNYFETVKEQSENQSVMIHDIKNHIIVVKELCSSNRLNDASEYLDQLLELPSLSKKIHFTKNENLDIILNVYVNRCEQKHIDFHIDSDGAAIDFLKVTHMTALFCNLLDNAVEAAEICDDPFISLVLRYDHKISSLKISLSNSSIYRPCTNNNKLVSSKKDSQNHGYGSYSISRIVNSYNGHQHFYYDQNSKIFHTIILLTNTED